MAGETILVIDDSPTIRKVVAANLRKSGYAVETAVDGQDGLEVAQRLNPDFILLDFVMPRMNGFQFCRALQGISNLACVPVVLMSAKGDKIGAKFIQQMGVVDSITKPFSPEALLAVTDHVLTKFKNGTNDATARIDLSTVLDELDDELDDDFEDDAPVVDETSSRISMLPFEDGHCARDVAEDIAARVADILTTALPDLSDLGDEIEEALSKHLTPKALEKVSQTLARLEPTVGRAAFVGDVAKVPLAEVFQLLQLQMQSGCFEVRRDRFRALVYIRNGRVDLAQAREGRKEFLLGRYLVEEEIIDRTELELLLRNQPPGETALLGQQLLLRGYLTKDDLDRLLERQTCELVYEVLRWRRGRFAFRPDVSSREAELAGLGLSAESILMEGFRRVDEWRVIEQKIEDFDVVVVRDDAAVERFGLEQLTGEELTLLDAVNGRRAVRDLVDITQMSSFLVSKLLFRLLSVKLIRKRSG